MKISVPESGPLFVADCDRIAKGEMPSRAWETDIYVTRRCNMSCSYCYVKDYFDREYPFIDPDLQQLYALIDRIADRTFSLLQSVLVSLSQSPVES